MIVIDLNKQQALDADHGAIQQINFTWNLDWTGNTMFFIFEEAKGTVLDLFTRKCKSIVNVLYNNLIFISTKWLSTIV